MRIIGGRWRGRQLSSPPSISTRPILDRVKESIFDTLGARLATPGCLPPIAVLDLFAGTGAMGLEALSRGAVFCRFVEKDARAVRHLRRNVERLEAASTCQITVGDALRVSLEPPAVAQRYRVVFVDPPYRLSWDSSSEGPTGRFLARLSEQPTLEPSVVVVLRHERETSYDKIPYGRLCSGQRREYGTMAVTWLTFMP